MTGLEQQIVHWLSEFAYHPLELYGALILLMFASSFGLPFPEEVALVSSGLIAYAATRPDLFPPPYEGAQAVNTYVLAAVCFFAVFLSDLLVFAIGRKFGSSIGKSKFISKLIDPSRQDSMKSLRERYGVWACGIFRFTPGIRFPGHLSCGAMGVPFWKFIAIDGTAALLTVPTQVILVAEFGETVLGSIKQFKIILLSTLAGLAVLYIAFKLFQYFRNRSKQGNAPDVAATAANAGDAEAS